MQNVTLEDIEATFLGYQSDVVPQDRSVVDGFAEWAQDVAGEEAGRELWDKRYVLRFEIMHLYAEVTEAPSPIPHRKQVEYAADRFIDAYESELYEVLVGGGQ